MNSLQQSISLAKRPCADVGLGYWVTVMGRSFNPEAHTTGESS